MRSMSFWTSFSSKRRPMRRFTAYSVFLGLVTAWRLAGAPTRTSPSSMYATTEGVVRAPSEFSMTFGTPFSITATQEFVVPRSMPMIFAMSASLECCGFDRAERLVPVRIEFLAHRVDFLHGEFLEDGVQLPQGELDARPHALAGGG